MLTGQNGDNFFLSACNTNKSVYTNDDLTHFLIYENNHVNSNITFTSFSLLKKWQRNTNGNIQHETGKFYSVEALCYINKISNIKKDTPIIVQPEIGILGIITKKINGKIHFLMQFKIEPGNINKVQISPTVQATKSNYTSVHQGKTVPYLDFFFNIKNDQILFNILQSEQTKRFYRKNNRNCIIVLPENFEIEILPNFKWFTLEQILFFVQKDNIINMNSRSIIAGIDWSLTNESITLEEAEKKFRQLFPNINDNSRKDFFISAQNCHESLYVLKDLIEWINKEKSNKVYQTKIIPLKEVTDLFDNDHEIYALKDKEFRVKALDVKIEAREVTSWCQPIVEDFEIRLNGFIAKKINGILHFLAKLSEDFGNTDGAEIGPTIQGKPLNPQNEDFDKLNQIEKIFYTDHLANVLLSVYQSDEGGRFYHVQNKHVIIQIDDDIPIEENYRWVTVYQLKKLMMYSDFVNMEARSIISCISYC